MTVLRFHISNQVANRVILLKLYVKHDFGALEAQTIFHIV